MEMVNVSSHSLQLKITLHKQSGGVASERLVSIPAHGQYDALVHSFEGRSANAYGSVCVTHDGAVGELDGRMVYYKGAAAKRSAKAFEFAFALPFSNGKTGVQHVGFNTFQPSLVAGESNNPVANWVQLSNQGNVKATGRLRFYGLGGERMGDDRVVLNAGARLDVSAHRFGIRKVGLVEWLPDSSSASFQLRNVRYFYDNTNWSEDFTTAFQLEGQYGSGELMAVPISTDTESSVLELSNVLGEESSVAIEIYNEGGDKKSEHSLTLPAKASRHLVLDEILGARTKGIALVKGSKRQSVIATAMQYGRRPDGGISYLFGVPAKAAYGVELKGSYNTYLNQESSLWMINPKTTAQGASISLESSDGRTVLDHRSMVVPSHGLVTLRVNDYETGEAYGVASVHADGTNSLIGWMFRRRGSEYVLPAPVRE